MGASRYRMSLRISHPSIDTALVTSVLGLKPKRSWKAGEGRTTPAGKPLEGRNKDTYWCADICDNTMPRRSLSTQINEALDKLMAHRKFLQNVRMEGGRCEFFIGWFLRSEADETFPHSLMARMAELGIDLSLCVYHDDRPTHERD